MSQITERQQSYICALLEERDLFASPKFFDAFNALNESELNIALQHMKTVQVPSLTKDKASKWINQLLSLPKKQQAPQSSGPWKVVRYEDPNTYAMKRSDRIVPRGSYAIERNKIEQHAAFTNDLLFFSVWISDNGERWAVRMYLSDERVKISRSLQYDVLDAIGQAPADAAARYGLEIGKCGVCGRTLTNDESRARGIGPICAERWGW